MEGAIKGEVVFRRAFNGMLDLIAGQQLESGPASELKIANLLGVSRTTVRKVITAGQGKALLDRDSHGIHVLRRPEKRDYFPRPETVATTDKVEKLFMEWMLRGDRKPGDVINGLELAREFGISTGAIREYLNRFSRFGLIEKRPNSSWVFRGFTREFALELSDIREMFEVRSALAFVKLPEDSPAWTKLALIESEHRDLLKDMKSRFHDFSDLDERFHRLINGASENRFIVAFYDVITLIFHYHYQWNKADEADRNATAVEEHLTYIQSLFSRRADHVEEACRSHLRSARKTLLDSIFEG